ncbi:MAG: RNA polymerase sigma factor [Candidatus Hydrogenedentes bacterium]|nr:RNA polymerase sigma factor [Candidatus Hydrogenedentota bacterium]
MIEEAKINPEAFGELYDRHYDTILAYVFRRTMDISVAEDLTSNTFFSALKALPKYTHKAPFSAWLYRIASNEIRMHWRRTGRHSRIEEARRWQMAFGRVEFSTHGATDMEEFQEHLARLHAVRRAVESLPERFRVPLALRYFEGLSHEEIAAVLNKRVGTVKVHVHRGLTRLRKMLRDATETPAQ